MTSEQIIEVGKALLPYLRNDLSPAELGTAAHDAVAALRRTQTETQGSYFIASEPERFAKDQLHAAAPDLLTALKLILPLAKGYVAANRVGSNQRYIDVAEAAVTKATGES